MPPYENSDIEYKEIYTKNIRNEVIDFANTDGGTLYVGIRSDGTVIGVPDPDDTMLRIAGSLNDSFQPNVMPLVQIKAMEISGRSVVCVTVSVGTERPYYIGRKGLKPGGVYVRRGSASIPLSGEGIRRMIANSYGDSYESGRSLGQDLTFTVLQKECSLRNIDISTPEKMKNLKLLGEDGLYTNLVLLLSDQCPVSIKVARFQVCTKEKFQDRRNFSGSILKQLEDVNHFLNLLNHTEANFEELRRIDTRNYPATAIREVLLNSVVHRDYTTGRERLQPTRNCLTSFCLLKYMNCSDSLVAPTNPERSQR